MKKSIHSVCSPLLPSPFNQSIVGYLIKSQPVVKHVLFPPLLGRLHDDYPRYPVAHEQTEAHFEFIPAPAAAAVLPGAARCCQAAAAAHAATNTAATNNGSRCGYRCSCLAAAAAHAAARCCLRDVVLVAGLEEVGYGYGGRRTTFSAKMN
eukprot:CAMPEP_0178994284 /NCGR_PEP_ID=MMETSP0795-20121207/7189_1 /TAXON_ID=88552 /ORGANISM="Amoebophrya sp., Strain Ameob2" /LENGTH=150 /DNA_ID=CAMNT_0020686469 /DNA_START=160 /DNA_END=612 /DNA_ORIENTATION=+